MYVHSHFRSIFFLGMWKAASPCYSMSNGHATFKLLASLRVHFVRLVNVALVSIYVQFCQKFGNRIIHIGISVFQSLLEYYIRGTD